MVGKATDAAGRGIRPLKPYANSASTGPRAK